MMINLSKLERLDEDSLAEIEKVIEVYEEIRTEIKREINAGKNFENLHLELEEFLKKQNNIYTDSGSHESAFKAGAARRMLSILKQMKNENCSQD